LTLLKRKWFLPFCLCVGAAIPLLLPSPEAVASEGPTAGRKIWDNIMLWVNFGILVFFFFRYAKKPLTNLLRAKRSEIEKDLNQIESQHSEVKALRDNESERLSGLENRLDEIKSVIIDMGTKEREQIIADAHAAAEKMIRSAKAYADYRLALARKALSDELADLAISLVEKKINNVITEDDEDRLLNQFIANVSDSKSKVA
jgi:F-type H+-transporting ATPase subunit b